MPGFHNPSGGALSPVRLAAAGKVFERLARKDGVIGRLLGRENWKSMAGVDVKPIGDAQNPMPSWAPIEVYQDTAAAEGGDRIDIPVTGFLSGMPVGDAEVEGLEESIPIYMRHLYLTVGRKAVSKATSMQAQRTPQLLLNAINDSNSWLHDWYGKHQDGNYMHTLLTGYDVLATTYREMEGQSSFAEPFSHPNAYVPGHGAISYTNGRPGTAGFETTTKDALAGMIGDPTKKITLERVMYFQHLANNEWSIPQVMAGGRQWTIWLVDPWTLYDLKRDSDYIEYHKHANVKAENNPLFTAASAYVEGNLFFAIPGMFGVQVENDAIATCANSALSMPMYGPTAPYWISDDGRPVDDNEIKAAMIVGPGALYALYGRERMAFAEQTGDYGRRKGVALEWYKTCVRGDIFDPRNEKQNGANAFFRNYSSAVAWFNTSRPQNLSY